MIITRLLPARTFTELANGDAALVVVGYLHEAQQGKHLMLLHAVAEATNAAGPVSPTVAAMHAGSKLPVTEQRADPCSVAWLSSLPHIGGCPRGCLVRLNPGLLPEFSYRACAVATPALRADARFAGRAAKGHRSIPRLINASDVRRSLGGRGHELAVLHQVCLACNRAALLGVRTGGRRLSDRPAHLAERRRLCRRDNPAVVRFFATSCPPDPVMVAAPRSGVIAMNRGQPTCGSVDRPGPLNPLPAAAAMAVGVKGRASGPVERAAWFT